MWSENVKVVEQAIANRWLAEGQSKQSVVCRFFQSNQLITSKTSKAYSQWQKGKRHAANISSVIVILLLFLCFSLNCCKIRASLPVQILLYLPNYKNLSFVAKFEKNKIFAANITIMHGTTVSRKHQVL